MRIVKNIALSLIISVLVLANVCAAMNGTHNYENHVHSESEINVEQQSVNCCEESSHQDEYRALVSISKPESKKANTDHQPEPSFLSATIVRHYQVAPTKKPLPPPDLSRNTTAAITTVRLE